jgi:hypothetical protein
VSWITGNGAQEEIIDRHDNLTVARAIYRGRVSQYPGRLVMLCDRARILARSDRPDYGTLTDRDLVNAITCGEGVPAASFY